MAGAVVVWSDDKDVVSEGMLARCNTSNSKSETTFQQSSTNVLKTPVVAAIDNMVGLVEFVLTSKDDGRSGQFEPFLCLKQECVVKSIFSSSEHSIASRNMDVFSV